MAKLTLAQIQALAAQVAETGPDLNKQSGGDYKPPEKGATQLRFIEYIETGVHTTGQATGKYGLKTKARAQFGFELSGKKHPPKEVDGKQYPHIIRFELVIGQGKKNDYSKLFKLMVQEFPGRKNFAQLLGEAFRGRVVHREYKKRNGEDGIAAELKDGDAGFTITGTTYEDPETETVKKIKVAPPLSDLKLFLWDYADTDQWDDLFIDGTYDDGNTKNKIQEKIKAAENFTGSPIYNALIEADRQDELAPAPVFARGEQQDKQEVPVTGTDEPEEEDEPEVEKVTKPAKATKATKEPDPEPEPGPEEEDEEAVLLAQLAAAKARKEAAAKEGAKKASGKPVAAPKPTGKAKVAKTSDDPLQGL